MQKSPPKKQWQKPQQKTNVQLEMRERVNRYPLRKHELSERKRVRYQNEETN